MKARDPKKNNFQDPKDIPRDNLTGAMAEIGVRLWYGLPLLTPEQDYQRFLEGKPDIDPDVDVKGATGRNGQVNLLVMNLHDDWRYIFGWAWEGEVILVGWVWGHLIPVIGEWTEPQEGRPCWKVRFERLSDIWAVTRAGLS